MRCFTMPYALITVILGLIFVPGCDQAPAPSGATVGPASAQEPAPPPTGLTPSAPVTAPPISDPHSASALLARLQSFGYPASSLGIRRALESSDLGHRFVALRIARDSRDRSVHNLVKSMEFHQSADIRLAAATYLAALGDEDALDRLHFVADVTFETIDASDPSAQRRLVEAVRILAQLEYEGYCYQLTYLLMNGIWSARSDAAAALGSFHDLSDPTLEQAWLRALEILDFARAHEDERVRVDMPFYAQGVFTSALQQRTTTKKILDAFETARQNMEAQGEADLAAQAGAVLDHLSSCDLTVAIDEAPPFTDDPRKLASKTALQVVRALQEGEVRKIKAVLDVEYGVYEGMSAEEWIAEMELEFPPGVLDHRSWSNEQARISRPSPGHIEVDFTIDLLNRISGKWEAVSIPMEVNWWGYGWHITYIDRFVDYVIEADPEGEFGAILALPEDLEEPLAPLLGVFKIIDDKTYEEIAQFFTDDGVFRNRTKQDFVDSLTKRPILSRVDRQTIIPADYIIDRRTDDVIDGRMQIASIVQGMPQPVRVNYTFRVVRRDGRWLVHEWTPSGRP